jgi:hypothetical protein
VSYDNDRQKKFDNHPLLNETLYQI